MTSTTSITSFETLKKTLLLCIAMGYGLSGMAESLVKLPEILPAKPMTPLRPTVEELNKAKEREAAALREKKEAEKKANQSRADLDNKNAELNNKNAEIERLKAELAKKPKERIITIPAPAPAPQASPAPVSIASPPTPTAEIIDNRYQILANGAEVKDVQTNLIWQRCQVGMNWNGNTCTGEAKKFTFENAKKQAGNGWRVPTIRELSSLIYCSSGKMKNSNDVGDGGAPIKNWCDGDYTKPTINTKAFPNTPSGVVWSSSPYVGDSSDAWFVSFYYGNVSGYLRSGNGAVRLVR
ncbi:MAG: hypothetical protein RIR79_714 [Pseudomonadota bacterium]|jgi:hypothetical protein